MNPGAFIFFALFAIVLVASYLAIRRQWLAPAVIAVGTIVSGIVLMTLFSLAQGNSIFHAIIVGLLLGAAFSIALMAIAWYFQGNELREQYMQGQGAYAPPDDYNE